MMSTFTPSQTGAFIGSLRSTGGAMGFSSVERPRSSGPVTESNGLRERMGSALVALTVPPLDAGMAFVAIGVTASCFSSALSVAPNRFPTPRAPKKEATDVRASVGTQKCRLRS